MPSPAAVFDAVSLSDARALARTSQDEELLSYIAGQWERDCDAALALNPATPEVAIYLVVERIRKLEHLANPSRHLLTYLAERDFIDAHDLLWVFVHYGDEDAVRVSGDRRTVGQVIEARSDFRSKLEEVSRGTHPDVDTDAFPTGWLTEWVRGLM